MQLQAMPSGVERELVLFRWKHKNTNIGLFSTAHGGDCSGNFLKAMTGKFEWDEYVITNGKKDLIEYERNFNLFVAELRNCLSSNC